MTFFSMVFSIIAIDCTYMPVTHEKSKSVLCSYLDETSGAWCVPAFHSSGVIEIQASTRVTFPLCFLESVTLFFSAFFFFFSGKQFCKVQALQMRC